MVIESDEEENLRVLKPRRAQRSTSVMFGRTFLR
jgi:hypothetical protein